MDRISAFGRYEGYSAPRYDGFVRSSFHLPMRDGVRLAVDLLRPARGGAPHTERLPVVLQMTPYNRAQFVEGRLQHILSPYPTPDGREGFNNLAALSAHGYVMVAFDVRGQGASFGAFTGCFTAEEGRDAADVIAWLREQPWCSGRIGMLGSSYGGQTQFLAAALAPRGLQALFPCHSLFDIYDVFFPGGLAELSIPRDWGAMVDALAGRTAPSTVAPVDGADGPALLAQAIEEHRSTPGAREVFAALYASRFRDGIAYFEQAGDQGSQNLCTLLPRLREAAVPAYHWGGWNDYYPGQAAMWFCNWRRFAPARLTLGPWTHSPRTFSSPRDDEDLRLRFVESLRWFDRWLKDIDNGVDSELPVHFAVQQGHRFRHGDFEREDDAWHWRASAQWPLRETRRSTFWLGAGPSASVASSNDGALSAQRPEDTVVQTMAIDAAVSTGPHNRMGASFLFVPQRLPEMSALDARCLTWTTAPLEADLVLAGTPEVHVAVSADAPDVALVFWLEDVDRRGRSTLITYGHLRASHRAVGEAPYDTAGALWHPGRRDLVDATPPLDAGPSQVALSLLPVASRFERGHRLRLTLAGADAGNLEPLAPGATLRVHLGPDQPCTLALPVLP